MTNGNNSAFPEPCTDEGHSANVGTGLTKREYFAGLAMQGMIAEWNGEQTVKEMAKRAIVAADALIKELNKEL